MHLVSVDTYIAFGNGKKRPAREGHGSFKVFGSNGVIGHCDEFNSPAGTIIIGRVGSFCGSLHYSPEQCWVTDNAIKGIAKTGADARYCYYLLLTKDLHALRGGSGQPLINQTSLKSLEVPERSFADQKAIAHILGTLDDKIELNQKMNQTLEEMAKAIFKSWFVDFDPVRAKAEGRPTGLPPEISDLFPDELVDSEIGETPKGWVVTDLANSAAIKGGKQIKNVSNDSSGCVPVYGGNGIMGWTDRSNVDSFTVIFGRVGANCGSVNWVYDKAWIGNNASSVTPKENNEFLLQVLLMKDFQGMRSGSAQPFISNTSLGQLRFVYPVNGPAKMYCEVARPIRLLQENSKREIKILSELRDTLLPKLISGELRIPDAEKFLEEAGI